MTSEPPARTSTRATALLLAAITVLGFGLRIWYASSDPTPARFVDERYSFDNVRSILLRGTLRPARAYYPSPFVNVPPAALLAGAMAYERATGKVGSDVLERGKFGRWAHWLARGLQVAYGTATLPLLFLVGRRVFSPAAGLIAAAALAFMPWHIHASGYFKPDALLCFAIVLVLLAAVRALDEPTATRHIVVGAAIAMAMSAKLTGGTIAAPFAVATLALGRREPRRVALLSLAGATSAAAFVLLNPYWRSYLFFLGGLQRDYAMRAEWSGMTRAEVPRRLLAQLLEGNALGPLFGTLALVGLAFLAVRVARSTLPRHTRASTFLLVAFPVLYTALYAVQTAYFKGNNFLPVMPFAALAAAALVVEIWCRLDSRLPARRPWLAAAGIATLAATLVPAGPLYVYRSSTPTTLDLAKRFLHRELPTGRGRLVYVERFDETRPAWEGRRTVGDGWTGLLVVDDLARLSAGAVTRADAVIFPQSRLDWGKGSLHRELADRAAPGRLRRYRAAPFAARGPARIAVAAPLTSVGDAVQLGSRRCADETEGCFRAEISAEIADGELVSLLVWASFNRLGERRLEARAGESALALAPSGSKHRTRNFVSERFVVAPETRRLRIRSPSGSTVARQLTVGLQRWQEATP